MSEESVDIDDDIDVLFTHQTWPDDFKETLDRLEEATEQGNVDIVVALTGAALAQRECLNLYNEQGCYPYSDFSELEIRLRKLLKLGAEKFAK